MELIAGDLCETAYDYMEEYPATLFRIVHLSVNLYEPTLAALKAFYPRLVNGGIIAINSINWNSYRAQRAMFEVMGTNLEVRTFPFFPNISYIVKNG